MTKVFLPILAMAVFFLSESASFYGAYAGDGDRKGTKGRGPYPLFQDPYNTEMP